jgi:hypothetical protein
MMLCKIGRTINELAYNIDTLANRTIDIILLVF